MYQPPGADVKEQIERELGPQYQLRNLPEVFAHRRMFPDGVHLMAPNNSVSEQIPPERTGQFCLDFTPRPLMAAGAMIDLLVRTNVGHYIDFRGLDGLYVEFGEPHGLQHVPGSRSDVFQNRFVSMIEKRLLMRFVKKCYDESDSLADETEQEIGPRESTKDTEENRTFIEEMSEMNLTEKLQEFILHSIAFATGKETSLGRTEGVDMVRTYQQSMMKYGTRTPFLYPNYGCGELSQAFCRLCAVNGGVYVLRRGLTSVISRNGEGEESESSSRGALSNESTVAGVVTTEQEVVKCKHVFISTSLANLENTQNGSPNPPDRMKTWRLMAILDGSVASDTSLKRVMITIPRGRAGNNTSAVRMRQMDEAVMTCPPGFFILYAETLEAGGREEDVLAACRHYTLVEADNIDSVIDGSSVFLPSKTDVATQGEDTVPDAHVTKPRVLWGVTFSRTEETQAVSQNGAILVSRSDDGHDSNGAIAEAKRCFKLVHDEDKFFATAVAAPEAKSTGATQGFRTELTSAVENNDESKKENRAQGEGS